MERSTDVYNIHYNQYLHNKNFISKGINNQCENFYDWEITVDFYAGKTSYRSCFEFTMWDS